ncbi:MAG: c-type cytochrome [Opitutales bacterium]
MSEPSDPNAKPPKTDDPDKLKDARSVDYPEMEPGRFEDLNLQERHSQLMREKSEPVELYKPVPMALMWGIFILFAWAGYYLADYTGGWRADVFSPGAEYAVETGDEVEVDYYAVDWQMDRGATLYSANCAACHQSDGNGLAGVYPPLAGSRWVTTEPAMILKILLRGLQGPIEVKGAQYQGLMPSYGENGSGWRDRDIAAAATYVRRSFGNDASQITQAMIEEARAAVADRAGEWTAEELLAIHSLDAQGAGQAQIDAATGEAAEGEEAAADGEDAGDAEAENAEGEVEAEGEAEAAGDSPAEGEDAPEGKEAEEAGESESAASESSAAENGADTGAEN